MYHKHFDLRASNIEIMLVEGDKKEVQPYEEEELEELEEHMGDDDEGEQRRKESQPLIVKDTIIEVVGKWKLLKLFHPLSLYVFKVIIFGKPH